MKYIMEFLVLDDKDYNDFRFCEMQSLLDYSRAKVIFENSEKDVQNGLKTNPFVVVETNKQNALIKVMERSVTIKNIYFYLSEGDSIESSIENLNESERNGLRSNKSSYAFKLHIGGQKLKNSERLTIIKNLVVKLDLSGKIQLKRPVRKFCFLGHKDSQRFFFALKLKKYNKKMVRKLRLADRFYIGPTSTDTRLSLLMDNQAQIGADSIVFDPFVGTGSILIAAAFHGSFCVGSDIDMRVLKNKNKEMNIFGNFRQYKLPLPEILRLDLSHVHLKHIQFDAIICDPPYGIRAGAWKVSNVPNMEIPAGSIHYQKMENYSIKNLEEDLQRLALKLLKRKGRLVYLHSVEKDHEDYDEDDTMFQLDIVPGLKLVSNSLQKLYGRCDRRLLTFVKCD